MTGNEQAKFLHTYAAGLPCTGLKRDNEPCLLYNRPARPAGPSAIAKILPGIKLERTTSNKACVLLSSVSPAIKT